MNCMSSGNSIQQESSFVFQKVAVVSDAGIRHSKPYGCNSKLPIHSILPGYYRVICNTYCQMESVSAHVDLTILVALPVKERLANHREVQVNNNMSLAFLFLTYLALADL